MGDVNWVPKSSKYIGKNIEKRNSNKKNDLSNTLRKVKKLLTPCKWALVPNVILFFLIISLTHKNK